MKQRVRVRAQSDYRGENIVVQARVHRSWVTIARLQPTSDDFEDNLAEAVARAERHAAACGAWT